MSPLKLIFYMCVLHVQGQNVSNIMVATGWNNVIKYMDEAEVINAANIQLCPSFPANYPLEVYFAVALQQNSKMVVCGGRGSGVDFYSDCYSYSSNNWNLEPFRLEPARSGSMSAEIRPGEWMILGGAEHYNDSASIILAKTEILTNGIFTSGPDLPEPIVAGTAVMLNESSLLVTSAETDSSLWYFSPRNFILDIDSMKWTEAANRTEKSGPSYSASGTFYNSTADEIQVATIGYYGIEIYSPKDDIWHEGISFPSPITYLTSSIAVQHERNSFILIGGQTNVGLSSDIFIFNENGLSVLKRNVLSVSRRNHVAMQISNSDFACL